MALLWIGLNGRIRRSKNSLFGVSITVLIAFDQVANVVVSESSINFGEI